MNLIKSNCFSNKNISTTLLFALCIIFFIPSAIYEPITFGQHNMTAESKIISALFYSFCHINLFHLLANLMGVYAFRPRISTLAVSYIIAILVSLFEVSPTPVPTCGISVLLYAAISRRYVAWRIPPYRPLFLNVFLCGINFLLGSTIYNFLAHLLAFSLGWIVWAIYYKCKKY